MCDIMGTKGIELIVILMMQGELIGGLDVPHPPISLTNHGDACCSKRDFFTSENVIVSSRTVEEGKSMQFECDSRAAAPFYYYRFYSQYINPQNCTDHLSDFPWAVTAINTSINSPVNRLITPNFLNKTEQPLKISNFTVEFHNNIICCQGQDQLQDTPAQNASSPSMMICYKISVCFSPQLIQPIRCRYGEWIVPLHPSYGQEVVISCPLEGNPLVLYQWYFNRSSADGSSNGSVAIHGDSNLNITLLNNNRTLYFSEFKEEHNGTYICTAENLLGKTTFSHFPPVEVGKCAAFQPAHPSVTINASHNLVAYVGDDLSIDCIVASSQESDTTALTWFKNFTHIIRGERVYHSKSSFDRVHCRQIVTLYFKNLTFNDSGYYSCYGYISNYDATVDTMLLTVTVPPAPLKQLDDYRSLIIKISIPVGLIIILSAISITVGFFYYQHVRQVKLQKALEEYRGRPLPKKGDYQYEFFFAMTEEDEDKLEVDKLYVALKQSFTIYYQLDQYLPGRTKVEMVTDGIKNSRFIVIMLSKAYLEQKDEIVQLELIYTMNRIEKELTKCAFIVTLQDKLFIPYKLRHIMKFSNEGADEKLKELALSTDTYGPDFIDALPEDTIEDAGQSSDTVELLNVLSNDEA